MLTNNKECVQNECVVSIFLITNKNDHLCCH